jgi:hypothetical protein
VTVKLDDGKQKDEWSKEAHTTPTLKLSAAVSCERDGRVWALTECLTNEQAAQRQIASSSGAPAAAVNAAMPPLTEPAPAPEPPRVICDNEIVLQGETYPLSYTSQNRAEAAVPAMNGCPAEDVFVFQCQPKSTDDPYGQWVQIEAKMAPACEDPGHNGGFADPARGNRQ